MFHQLHLDELHVPLTLAHADRGVNQKGTGDRHISRHPKICWDLTGVILHYMWNCRLPITALSSCFLNELLDTNYTFIAIYNIQRTFGAIDSCYIAEDKASMIPSDIITEFIFSVWHPMSTTTLCDALTKPYSLLSQPIYISSFF